MFACIGSSLAAEGIASERHIRATMFAGSVDARLTRQVVSTWGVKAAIDNANIIQPTIPLYTWHSMQMPAGV